MVERAAPVGVLEVGRLQRHSEPGVPVFVETGSVGPPGPRVVTVSVGGISYTEFMELVRLPEGEAAEPLEEPRALNVRELRLGLTEIECRAVEQLVTGAPGTTAEFVSARAAALATDNGVRRRSLAKACAIQEALSAQFSSLLTAAVARRDGEAVKLLDKALTGSTRRFTLLMNELRAEMTGGQSPVVQVAIAGDVNVARGP